MFHFAFNSLVFLSFIDVAIACANRVLNWNCPGGYIDVHDAKWLTVGTTICPKTLSAANRPIDVITEMKNRCDNKTSCGFILNDSNLGVTCAGKCTGLSYIYECVSKSFAYIWVYYLLTNSTTNQKLR